MHKIFSNHTLFLPGAGMLLAMLVFSSCNNTPSGPDKGADPRDGGSDTTSTGTDTTGPDTIDTSKETGVLYDFDDGMSQGWTLNDPEFTVRDDQFHSGSHSIGATTFNNSHETVAFIEPDELGENGNQITAFSYYYRETTDNNGTGIRLLDNSGDMVVATATGNPNYNTYGANGFKAHEQPTSSNYDVWVKVQMAFDWSAGRADITFTDTESDVSETYNVDLAKMTGVKRIEIADYHSPDLGGFYLGKSKAFYYWADDISFTTGAPTPSDNGTGGDNDSDGDDNGTGGYGNTDGRTPGGNPAGGKVADIVPINEATLVEGATGDPVVVTAIQKNDDGSTTTWSGSVKPGKIQRLHDGDNLSWITVNHIPEGGVTVGNVIAGHQYDIILDNLKMKAPDGRVLYDDEVRIYPRTHTRPWWYAAPQANPNWDKSLLPKWKGNTPNASMASTYDRYTGEKSKDGQDRNGPMGRGIQMTGFGNTGPHPGIGIIPSWDTPYIVNPSPDNERVMRSMADAFAVVPFHVRDPGTLKMLTITDWPWASCLKPITYSKAKYNPCRHPSKTSTQPIRTAGPSAIAHGGGYGILATLVYNTSYDQEELAFNANWQVLMQNPGYRAKENGNLWSQASTRGIGWSIRTVAAAATLSENYKKYFSDMLDYTHDSAIRAHQRDGELPVNIAKIHTGSYHRYHISNFMNDYLVMGIGFAINMGHSDYQDLMNIFGQWPIQRLLDAQHEFATAYHILGYYPDGTLVEDWAASLQETAENGTGDVRKDMIARALSEEENSQALVDAYYGYPTTKRLPGDFLHGGPASPDNKSAYLRAATAFAKQYNVPRADQAWAEYLKHERVDFGDDMRYNIVPRN